MPEKITYKKTEKTEIEATPEEVREILNSGKAETDKKKENGEDINREKRLSDRRKERYIFFLFIVTLLDIMLLGDVQSEKLICFVVLLEFIAFAILAYMWDIQNFLIITLLNKIKFS